MPIIEENDLNYFVYGGPQINSSIYKMIIGGPGCPPPKELKKEEEEDGLQSTSNR